MRKVLDGFADLAAIYQVCPVRLGLDTIRWLCSCFCDGMEFQLSVVQMDNHFSRNPAISNPSKEVGGFAYPEGKFNFAAMRHLLIRVMVKGKVHTNHRFPQFTHTTSSQFNSFYQWTVRDSKRTEPPA
ncbi:uncharacterized protein [Physcomitrium patens]|uniref:uncharacterized protein isoform X1 n=1 Tax=Physcomitrium patens TaxID=3218 RepID=UPI003CCD7826